MNTIRILCSKGDNRFEYDPETQMDEAVTKFNELKSKGHTMFAVDPDTKETTLVEELFKTHVQVVAVPQIAGG